MEQWSFPIFTFDEAIQHYKNGKKITREGFKDTITKEDLLAQDWMVIERV